MGMVGDMGVMDMGLGRRIEIGGGLKVQRCIVDYISLDASWT